MISQSIVQPTNIKGKKKTPQRTPQQTNPPATASARPGQLPKAAVALCVLSGLTAAGAASPSGSNPAVPIKVPDAETLNMIGSVHPLNAWLSENSLPYSGGS
ncbi:hypothetical protein [Endozoicomonas sp. ONNA2]|uniref:hypothetical protein n=1 Tax=Endozoicomonas sp. ONNA2 TaxID=2828741 RepID=UPI002147C6BF|nr:hypothetical protein [Endozoicomonas sp. ONNA2]